LLTSGGFDGRLAVVMKGLEGEDGDGGGRATTVSPSSAGIEDISALERSCSFPISGSAEFRDRLILLARLLASS